MGPMVYGYKGEIIVAEKTIEEQRLIDEWLSKGNKITICPTGQTSDGEIPGYGWGKRKKKSTPKKKIKKN